MNRILTSSVRWLTTVPPPYRVLFFGSDRVSLQTLLPLVKDAKYNQQAVKEVHVVVPPGTQKRQVPVQQWAIQHNLPWYEYTGPSWSVESTLHTFDVAVVASFGYFLRPHVLDAFPMGALNMHPSLLPRYRGAAPMFHTILNGDTVTGVSIITLHPTRMDAGLLLDQCQVNLVDSHSRVMLEKTLSALGGERMWKTLAQLPYVLEHAHPQPPYVLDDDEIDRSKAPKITKDMGRIPWGAKTATQIHQMVLAFSGEHGGAFTFLGQKRLMVVQSRILPNASVCRPGRANYVQQPLDGRREVIEVECAGGTRLGCEFLRMETKSTRTALEFANGYLQHRAVEFE